ncbi:MAG TPA: RNA polymerase sigma factor [Qipengyuania sp.]|nr:RNA polymerase sigma factor [Qipengyuania sp.]
MSATREIARIEYRTLSDGQLAALCAAREPGAVRHLLGLYNQRLFRAAWSILEDRSEAEDAVQSAYINALTHMTDFAGRASLATWLTRITINEALGRRRAGRRRQVHLEGEGVAVLQTYREKLMRGSEVDEPDAAAARAELRKLLERAIAQLPRGFRAVFVLREVEGMSVDETAAALQIPPATVKTRLLRARRKLQDLLDPDIRGALTGSFPFAGHDCAALTQRVLAALTLPAEAD